MVLTGFLFLTMFISIFLGTTAPNRTWNKAKRALLNDASLCPAVLAAFGEGGVQHAVDQGTMDVDSV